MKSGNRSNALLVELLIVIMFFMLASTVLLQVFTGAEKQSRESGQMITQLISTQDLMDRLYASDQPEAVVAGLGFQQENGIWTAADESDGLTTSVSIREEKTASGILRYFTVSVCDGQNEPLITLNNARYQEATP